MQFHKPPRVVLYLLKKTELVFEFDNSFLGGTLTDADWRDKMFLEPRLNALTNRVTVLDASVSHYVADYVRDQCHFIEMDLDINNQQGTFYMDMDHKNSQIFDFIIPTLRLYAFRISNLVGTADFSERTYFDVFQFYSKLANPCSSSQRCDVGVVVWRVVVLVV